MPEITNKGRELALQIAPVTGTTRAMQETCSLICRHTGQRGSFGVKFSGDPRGCVVKLTGPRSRYDDWGGEGICVPR